MGADEEAGGLGRGPAGAADRPAFASMDAAASIGAWDRVVEQADDMLAVDPRTSAPPQ